MYNTSMDLKNVFIARDSMEAHFLCDLLKNAGIEATVLGDLLAMSRGEFPLGPETLPSIWVKDSDVAKALEIVDPFVAGGKEDIADASPWKCPACGEELEAQFTECWSCQTPRPKA